MARPSVYLGLGSNLGQRERNLVDALARLEDRGFHVTQRSSVYLTEPVGGPPQEWFLNAAVRGETALEPEALLEACLATEREMGRVRGEKHGPRTLDIDILLYGELVRDAEGLTVPHPRLQDRLFVLIPLVELEPSLRHPVSGLTVDELRRRCPDGSRVLEHDAGWSRH